MTLVCPFRLPAEPFRALGDRLLLIHGDRGPGAGSVPQLLQALPSAREVVLSDYEDAAWSDAVRERRQTVETAMLPFLEELSQRTSLEAVELPEGEGEVAGITYRVRGHGPALILLPLTLAASQWEPLLPTLAERYTTIVLGGQFLGMVPNLEDRMRGGYRGVVGAVVEAAAPQPGEQVVEIGCGSGAVLRWLAQRLPAAQLTGVDVNAYLLREAAALIGAEGLAERCSLQEGDAEALPMPSERFDVTLSFTVMEEVDADRMLAELVRITRPGGRVGVVVRATDMRPWINLQLPAELLQKVEGVAGAGAFSRGCSDASLYRRFRAAGLEPVQLGPQLGSNRADQSPDRLRFFVGRIAQALEPADSQAFRAAVRAAVEQGTMVWAEPYHCAVGRKR